MGAKIANLIMQYGPESSLVMLICSFAFRTLWYAFTDTEEAGVSRLEEKYPAARKFTAKWEAKWPLLKTALQLVSLISVVLFIGVALLYLYGMHISWIAAAFAIVILLLLLYLFVDMLPRILAESYADRLSVLFLPLSVFIMGAGFVIVWPISRLERWLYKRVLSHVDEENRPSVEEEIMSLVEQTDDDDLEIEEREIIRSVFEFGDTVVREVMTPRVDIIGVEDTVTLSECVEFIKDLKYSRFLVYHDTLDEICGMVHIKSLLQKITANHGDLPVTEAAHQVPFIPESMPINDLLKLLRTKQSQVAVVVDEYGGTAGLVSMEDIIEELVGDIHDEYDVKEHPVNSLSDGSVIVDAKLPVDEINEILQIHIPENEEYDSIGGYIFSILGRIPLSGETVEGLDFTVKVQEADARKITSARISKKEE